MRALALVVLVACGGAAPAPKTLSNADTVAPATTCNDCLDLSGFDDRAGHWHTVPDGKFVVLSFFATWIEGPLDVLGHVSTLAPRYAKHGKFFAFALDEPEDAHLDSYLDRRGNTLPVVFATKEVLDAFPEGWVMAVPTTLIYDRNGSFVDRLVGKDQHVRLTETLDRLMLAP